MSDSKKMKKNVDALGNEWVLAPAGWDRLNQGQAKLFETYAELKSVGSLIVNLGDNDLSGEDLYGLGLIILKTSKRISKISSHVSSAVRKNQEEN